MEICDRTLKCPYIPHAYIGYFTYIPHKLSAYSHSVGNIVSIHHTNKRLYIITAYFTLYCIFYVDRIFIYFPHYFSILSTFGKDGGGCYRMFQHILPHISQNIPLLSRNLSHISPKLYHISWQNCLHIFRGPKQ